MVTITLRDSGFDRYTMEYDSKILGRRYDDNSETITVVKPTVEATSTCTMIVEDVNGEVIDNIIVGDEPFALRNVITQHLFVRIGFSFVRQDGSVKNSNCEKFEFLNACKPYGFVPVEPEYKQRLIYLIANGFVKATYVDGNIAFYNMANVKLYEFNIGISGQGIENIEFVETLPTQGQSETTLYMLHKQNTAQGDFYEGNLWADDEWKKINIDLSNYYTKSEVDSMFVIVQSTGTIQTRTLPVISVPAITVSQFGNIKTALSQGKYVIVSAENAQYNVNESNATEDGSIYLGYGNYYLEYYIDDNDTIAVEYVKIGGAEIAQTTGDSESKVMSQKATSKRLNADATEIENIKEILTGYITEQGNEVFNFLGMTILPSTVTIDNVTYNVEDDTRALFKEVIGNSWKLNEQPQEEVYSATVSGLRLMKEQENFDIIFSDTPIELNKVGDAVDRIVCSKNADNYYTLKKVNGVGKVNLSGISFSKDSEYSTYDTYYSSGLDEDIIEASALLSNKFRFAHYTISAPFECRGSYGNGRLLISFPHGYTQAQIDAYLADAILLYEKQEADEEVISATKTYDEVSALRHIGGAIQILGMNTSTPFLPNASLEITYRKAIGGDPNYNHLINKPIENQDLSEQGFTPIANTYYRHIGTTTSAFTQGIVYLYNGSAYISLDGNALILLSNSTAEVAGWDCPALTTQQVNDGYNALMKGKTVSIIDEYSQLIFRAEMGDKTTERASIVIPYYWLGWIDYQITAQNTVAVTAHKIPEPPTHQITSVTVGTDTIDIVIS